MRSRAAVNGTSRRAQREQMDRDRGAGYKPTDRLLIYASYSRGYKAGGFNLDRSALGTADLSRRPIRISRRPACSGFAPATCSSIRRRTTPSRSARNIRPRHRPERRRVPPGVQQLPAEHVQRLGFLVQNINGCSDNLNGADTDNNPATGACTGKPARRAWSAQGVELEAFTRPMHDLQCNAGVTMADTQAIATIWSAPTAGR